MSPTLSGMGSLPSNEFFILWQVFHCCDKILDINNLREERFILVHSFSPWERGCGRGEQLTSWWPGSRERECLHWLSRSSSLLYSIWALNLWDGAAYIQVCLLSLVHPLWKHLTDTSRVCFIDLLGTSNPSKLTVKINQCRLCCFYVWLPWMPSPSVSLLGFPVSSAGHYHLLSLSLHLRVRDSFPLYLTIPFSLSTS
jgi:hypothetical protein